MDYERLSKTTTFAFSGESTVQEPPRMFKNAYASQFHKNNAYSSIENYYPNYNNNMGSALPAQFHHQKPSTTNYSSNSNIGNNALINISGNTSYFNTNYPKQRFAPYHNKRSYANPSLQSQQQPNQRNGYQGYASQQQYQLDAEYENSLVAINGCLPSAAVSCDANNNVSLTNGNTGVTSSALAKNSSLVSSNGAMTSQEPDTSSCVTLQISNLDSTFDEHALKQHLINKLKPITSVISIYFEAISVAKIKLPSAYHAKQVISFLHRKKIGHKRITVSYTRDSSSMEPSTLRCQVVGILKVSPNVNRRKLFSLLCVQFVCILSNCL